MLGTKELSGEEEILREDAQRCSEMLREDASEKILREAMELVGERARVVKGRKSSGS